jgi:hypothetical protein
MKVSFFFLFLLSVVSGSASLEDLEEKIVEHTRAYDRLEFSVQSSFRYETEEGARVNYPELRETIRLHFPERGPAWKYWMQEIQDSFDDQWIVNRFRATNVTESRNFSYTPVTTEGTWSRGSITPWYEWDEEEGRVFFSFLGMNTMGLSLLMFDVSADLKNQIWERQRLQFTGKGQRDGIETLAFKGENTEFGVRYEVHFLSTSGLVVHWEANGIRENFSTVYHVDRLGIFEGTYYPKSGHLRQTPLRSIPKVDYKFEVTAVNRFDGELLGNWFPEWQPGTIVRDNALDKTINIPPSERQLRKAAETWSSYGVVPRSSTWIIFRITMVIAGIVLVLYALYLMRQKHRT